MESNDNVSKKALAYLSDVFPISPLFASAIVNNSGYFELIYLIVFSKDSQPFEPCSS